MKNLENYGVQEISQKQAEDINGGIHPALIVLGVVAVVAFGVGVYNGYQEAKQAAEKK